jgi:hypothetical protein
MNFISPRPALALSAVLAVSLCQAALADAPESRAVARQVEDAALKDDWGYRFVEGLTTEIGQRLAGTDAQVRAAAWAADRLEAAGFTNVHQEPFPMTGWVRGTETARIVSPGSQSLVITTLGGSVATPEHGIEAEIALFRTYAELLAAPPGSLTGRIAVVTERMARTQNGSGYGAAYPIRGEGPSEAAKRGAVAYLLRSIGTDETRRAHTGTLGYMDGVPRIPAAALSAPDAEQLERLAALGPVRIRLELTPRSSPTAQSSNLVAEIPGSEPQGQIVLIGAHLDSWDLATGAIDDGAGDAIVAGAARLIGALPRHPRRTIRVVLFGAEERGFSGKAYDDAHAKDADRIALAAEADFGARHAYSIMLPAGASKTEFALSLAAVEAPLSVFIDDEPLKHAGADVDGLGPLGVPLIAIRQDGTDYFDYHHTADDTFDKIDPAELAQATAAWAGMVYLAADLDVDFRSLAAAPPK